MALYLEWAMSGLTFNTNGDFPLKTIGNSPDSPTRETFGCTGLKQAPEKRGPGATSQVGVGVLVPVFVTIWNFLF